MKSILAVLLAGLGLFIYLRFENQLNETINNGLISRAQDVGTLINRSPGTLSGGGNLPGEDTFAQVLTPNGKVFGATAAGLSHGPLLTSAELAEATRGPVRFDRGDVEAVEGPARMDQCVVGLAACNDQMPCAQHDLYKPIRQRLKDYMNTTTLADLASSLKSKATWQARHPNVPV